MKHVIYALVGAVAFWLLPLSPCLAEPKTAGDAMLQVMSFNIRYDNPGDGQDRWSLRRERVAGVIGEGADVAGLQEALLPQVQQLSERLPQFGWYGVGRDDGEQRGEMVPIFYREDRFLPLERGSFWLSETPEVPGSKSWDAAITRLTSWMKLRDRRSGGEFFVFNTHFDHRGVAARRASARLVLDRMAEIAGDAPLVLTGDFNMLPDSDPYRILTGTAEDERPLPVSPGSTSAAPLVDTYRASGVQPEGPDGTWNGFHAVVPGQRIDFIFARRMQVHWLRILDTKVDGRFASDHLPVVAGVTAAGG